MRRATRSLGLSALCGLSLLATLLLAACASHTPAPVIERATPGTLPGEEHGEVAATPLGPGMYVVKKGDTLRAIALDHGQSYRDIAAWNNLPDPDKINVGQVLRVAPAGASPVAEAEPVAVARPVSMSGAIESTDVTDGTDVKPAQAAPALAVSAASAGSGEMLKRSPKGGKLPWSPEALASLQKLELPAPAAAETRPEGAKPLAEKTPPPAVNDNVDWSWPTTGKLLGGFVEGSSKGLDIAGKTGDPVLAAAAGKVILVSSALRGYGNFVIIKHNNAFLSVYAHNSRILVKEEQTVSKGQKIAEIGSSDADQPKLHFEIRRQGKPVDPAKFLPVR